jgi:hypothetical protein
MAVPPDTQAQRVGADWNSAPLTLMVRVDAWATTTVLENSRDASTNQQYAFHCDENFLFSDIKELLIKKIKII